MNKEFDFSKEFGNIDEKLIAEAGKPWTIRKNRILGLYSRKIAGAAAVIMICIALAGNSHVQAALREFTTKIGEILSFTKDLSSYTEIINQTQTQNGVSLTLNEVILDEHELLVSLRTDYGGQKLLTVWIDSEKTTIDGQHYQVTGSTNAGPGLDELEKPEQDIVLVEEYEGITLPEGEVRVHLVVDMDSAVSMMTDDSENFREYVYDFVFTAEELKEQTVKQDLDIAISGEHNGKLVLQNLTMNDLYCRIKADAAAWDTDGPDCEWKLQGEDSFGNPAALYGLIYDNEMRFETDDFRYWEDSDGLETDTFRMCVPDKNCDYLDLQLYTREIVWVPGTEVFDEDDEYYTQEAQDADEAYGEEEDHGWKPVGERFRIAIK